MITDKEIIAYFENVLGSCERIEAAKRGDKKELRKLRKLYKLEHSNDVSRDAYIDEDGVCAGFGSDAVMFY